MSEIKQLKLFISYSHKDEEYKELLNTHLSSLKRRGVINEWHDRKIIPGDEWDGLIKQELIDADIILLLISSDFIASKYCYETEIEKAMERHGQGDAIVIPIIVRPCDWKDLPFARLQGLPKNALPLTQWRNIDEAFLDVINGIKTAISNNILTNRSELELLQKPITFNNNAVIVRLPRGYVIITDVDYSKSESWSVTAHYYDYEGNLSYGTHYHSSYHTSWQTPHGQDTQCAKLNIPKGDWTFADLALRLIMDLRERKENESIEKIVQDKYLNNPNIQICKKGQAYPAPAVPAEYVCLRSSEVLRDIIQEFQIKSWKNYDFSNLHSDLDSHRRKACLFIYEKIQLNHPAYIFLNSISNEYDSILNKEHLRLWSAKFCDALNDASRYIK